MNSIHSFLIITAILLVSCDKETTPDSFDFASENEFETFQEYHSSDGKLIFSITELNDSRCPKDVVCIWQGMAEIKIEITKPVMNSFILNTNNNRKDSIAGYIFELKEVTPDPVSTKKKEQKDYRIILLIKEISK